MNALSNVLDDVKYNNGLQDAEAPDPKRKFSTVTDAERGAQLASLETSGAFGVATICAGPLGLYEFTRFLGGRDDSARALGSLLLECARYRAPLATATRVTSLREAHRGRLPDRNVSVDRFHRLPAPSLETDALTGRAQAGLAHGHETPENHLGLVKGHAVALHLHKMPRVKTVERRPGRVGCRRPRDGARFVGVPALVQTVRRVPRAARLLCEAEAPARDGRVRQVPRARQGRLRHGLRLQVADDGQDVRHEGDLHEAVHLSHCRDRRHHGPTMTSTPSTRRRLDSVSTVVRPTHSLIYAQA